MLLQLVYVIQVQDSKLYIAIGGIRNVKVENVESLLEKVRRVIQDNEFQIFNAQYIAGYRHLLHAALNATLAYIAGAGVSRSLSMESMLYTSCQDQIIKAIELLGLTAGIHNVALLVFEETQDKAENSFMSIASILGETDDSVLDLDESKYKRIMKVYSIQKKELKALDYKDDALTWALIERGALLRTRR